MYRLFLQLSLIASLAILSSSQASEERFVNWRTLIVTTEIEEAGGTITVAAETDGHTFRSFTVKAFGRKDTLGAADLKRLEGYPVSSIAISHEPGYESTGGYTVNIRLTRNSKGEADRVTAVMMTKGGTIGLIELTARSGAKDTDPLSDPLRLFSDSLVPAMAGSESAIVRKTWRGFTLRADRQAATKDQSEPSESGISLDASVRDAAEIPEFSDTKETLGKLTKRTIKFPAISANKDQGLVLTFVHGSSANLDAVAAIEKKIAEIQVRAEALPHARH